MLPEIDASEAIKALGINHPVEFREADLTGASHGITTGLTVSTDVIKVDPYALATMQHLQPEANHTLERVIAHELVHVKQAQEHPGGFDGMLADYNADMLFATHEDYLAHPVEAEAFAREMDLAKLVKVLS